MNQIHRFTSVMFVGSPKHEHDTKTYKNFATQQTITTWPGHENVMLPIKHKLSSGRTWRQNDTKVYITECLNKAFKINLDLHVNNMDL